MKLLFAVFAILAVATIGNSQSGRRGKEIKVPVPVPEVTETTPKPPAEPAAAPVTAEKNKDYRCSDDGTLELILESASDTEPVFTAKEVDARVVVTDKPKPGYTKEARRYGIQGYVTLRVLLSSDGKISRVRVMRGLPAGLSENAIRAACKIKFKPAMKGGAPVAQWLTLEYVFRLADSSIFAP